MNFREHLRVSSSIRVEVSALGRPDFHCAVRLPTGAPTHYLLDALRLSLGIEIDREEQYLDTDAPGIELGYGEPRVQRFRLTGLHEEFAFATTESLPSRVGDARVAVIEMAVLPPDPLSSGSASGSGSGSVAESWWSGPPPFRADLVNAELARRFGLVVPYVDTSSLTGKSPGGDSPLFTLLESLSPLRRVALRAHLDDTGILTVGAPDSAMRKQATAGLRALLTRLGEDGVAQDPKTGWLPQNVVREVTTALGWTDAAPSVPDPGDALVSLARRARLVRRFRGRVIVTRLGQSVIAGAVRAFGELVGAVRDAGRVGYWWGGQPRDVTLALLAIADGSAATIDDLPELVALGSAAAESGRDRYYEGLGHAGPSGYRGAAGDDAEADESGGPDGDASAAMRPLLASILAFSAPDAYGAISPAMRAVAAAALR